MQRVFFILFFFACSGCGYHWGLEKSRDAVSINVPYARGDLDGAFTTAMIRHLGESSFFQYDSSSPIFLKVSLRESGVEHIGYRHDRSHENHPKKTVLPTEGREKIQAEATLVEGEKNLLGPFTIDADADFDFITQNTLNDLTFINAQGVREPVLSFSMGQLEPTSSAQEAARKVVLDHLAQKIVHLMITKWKKADEKRCP